MTGGYAKGFVIEYVHPGKKTKRSVRINCRDCVYYSKNDQSCMKRPFNFRIDKTSHWKTCEFFSLSKKADDHKRKQKELEKKNNKNIKTKDNDFISAACKEKNTKVVNSEYLVKVKELDKVEHLKYGIGVVQRIENNVINVLFGAEKRRFYFPDAFEKGQLRLIEKE